MTDLTPGQTLGYVLISKDDSLNMWRTPDEARQAVVDSRAANPEETPGNLAIVALTYLEDV